MATLSLDDRLRFCKICTNRKLDFNTGLVCSLTSVKPAFEQTCPSFSLDEPEAHRLVALEKAGEEEEDRGGSTTLEGKGIKMGVLGGIIMAVIAVVWFFAGLAADRIFFYPPILFVIGVYAIIKGLANGNIAGNK
ncbi:MAG TPA: hypothetical protein VFE50_11590 [Cyclobacteriaceae bacterium]|nr:hypothetical protein [Cyclobacteriaceae bacterium]